MKTKLIFNKKWLILIAVLILVLALANTAYAGTTTSASGAIGDRLTEFLTNLSNLLVSIIKILQKIFWPVMLLIGGLMNNDILFGGGMEERLLDIWTQIRNFVNIAFVVILLGVALYNVTGIGKGDNYELKTFLPKFVIGLIAVNFSFIALKFVLDVTNLLTNAIYLMPAQISTELGVDGKNLNTTAIVLPCTPEPDGYKSDDYLQKTIDGQCKMIRKDLLQSICKGLYGESGTKGRTFLDKYKGNPDTNLETPEKRDKGLWCDVPDTGTDQYMMTTAGFNFFSKYNAQNSALILAIQFMNVINIDKVSEVAKSGNLDLSKLVSNLGMSVIIYVVYASAYLVLFVVLLVRLIVLWIALAVSPLIAIGLVFPNLKLGEEDPKDLFIKHAIVPIKIAAFLTLGYMILEQYRKATGTTPTDLTNVQIVATQTEISGISSLQQMIIAFGAVVVVWTGVFSAAAETKAAGFSNTIKDWVGGVGKKLSNAWKWVPVIPSGAGQGNITPFAVSQLMDRPLAQLEEKARQQASELTGQSVLSEQQIINAKNLDKDKIQNILSRSAPHIEKESYRKAVLSLVQHLRTKRTGAERRLGEEAYTHIFKRNKKTKPTRTQYEAALGKLKIPVRRATTAGAGAGAAGGASSSSSAGPHSMIRTQKGKSDAWNSLSASQQTALSGYLSEFDKAKTTAEQKAVKDKYAKNKDFNRGMAVLNSKGSVKNVNKNGEEFRTQTDISKVDRDKHDKLIDSVGELHDVGLKKIKDKTERKKAVGRALLKALGDKSKYTAFVKDPKNKKVLKYVERDPSKL